jgi:hypothetical protein
MTIHPPLPAAPPFWKTALLLSLLFFLIMSYGSFVVDTYSGGCVYTIPTYFSVIPVALAILLLKRVGAGVVVFLPFSTIGLLPVYYWDYATNHALLEPWGVLSWGVMGLLTGLAGDLAFKYLPRSLPERWRAALTGAGIGFFIFLIPLVCFTFFYVPFPPGGHLDFFTVKWFFSLPWDVVCGGFAGYTALAMVKKI